jgi:thioredoxin-dependent peroxiredoxin
MKGNMNLWTLTRTVRQMVQQAVTGNKGHILTEGTIAPDFEVPDENGKRHTLKEYRGRKVILWFFPRASTPGWTSEGQGFRERIEEFKKRNIVVLGASTDTAEDNRAFKTKHSFPFPLLCDTDGKLTLMYGASGFENAAFSNRITYVIDEKGIIEKAFNKVIPANHAEELLELFH